MAPPRSESSLRIRLPGHPVSSPRDSKAGRLPSSIHPRYRLPAYLDGQRLPCRSAQRPQGRRYTFELSRDPGFRLVPRRSDFSADTGVISDTMPASVCSKRHPLSTGAAGALVRSAFVVSQDAQGIASLRPFRGRPISARRPRLGRRARFCAQRPAQPRQLD